MSNIHKYQYRFVLFEVQSCWYSRISNHAQNKVRVSLIGTTRFVNKVDWVKKVKRSVIYLFVCLFVYLFTSAMYTDNSTKCPLLGLFTHTQPQKMLINYPIPSPNTLKIFQILWERINDKTSKYQRILESETVEQKNTIIISVK